MQDFAWSGDAQRYLKLKIKCREKIKIRYSKIPYLNVNTQKKTNKVINMNALNLGVRGVEPPDAGNTQETK